MAPGRSSIEGQPALQANEEATSGFVNNPTLTDANGNFIGTEMNAYTNFPADPYGYQNIAGPNNDGYTAPSSPQTALT